jgi:hypothetical protein
LSPSELRDFVLQSIAKLFRRLGIALQLFFAVHGPLTFGEPWRVFASTAPGEQERRQQRSRRRS